MQLTLLPVQPYLLGPTDACDVRHRLEKNLGILGPCTTVLPSPLTERLITTALQFMGGDDGPEGLPIFSSQEPLHPTSVCLMISVIPLALLWLAVLSSCSWPDSCASAECTLISQTQAQSLIPAVRRLSSNDRRRGSSSRRSRAAKEARTLDAVRWSPL